MEKSSLGDSDNTGPSEVSGSRIKIKSTKSLLAAEKIKFGQSSVKSDTCTQAKAVKDDDSQNVQSCSRSGIFKEEKSEEELKFLNSDSKFDVNSGRPEKFATLPNFKTENARVHQQVSQYKVPILKVEKLAMSEKVRLPAAPLLSSEAEDQSDIQIVADDYESSEKSSLSDDSDASDSDWTNSGTSADESSAKGRKQNGASQTDVESSSSNSDESSSLSEHDSVGYSPSKKARVSNKLRIIKARSGSSAGSRTPGQSLVKNGELLSGSEDSDSSVTVESSSATSGPKHYSHLSTTSFAEESNLWTVLHPNLKKALPAQVTCNDTEEIDLDLTCPRCMMQFWHLTKFNEHVKICQTPSTNSESQNIICKICNLSFRSTVKFYLHLETYHMINSLRVYIEQAQIQEASQTKFVCVKCRWMSLTMIQMVQHHQHVHRPPLHISLEIKNSGFRYNCSCSDFKSTVVEDVGVHLRSPSHLKVQDFSRMLFTCLICKDSYNKLEHYLLHTASPKHQQCFLVKAEDVRRRLMVKATNMGWQINSYCDFCNRKFLDVEMYNQHLINGRCLSNNTSSVTKKRKLSNAGTHASEKAVVVLKKNDFGNWQPCNHCSSYLLSAKALHSHRLECHTIPKAANEDGDDDVIIERVLSSKGKELPPKTKVSTVIQSNYNNKIQNKQRLAQKWTVVSRLQSGSLAKVDDDKPVKCSDCDNLFPRINVLIAHIMNGVCPNRSRYGGGFRATSVLLPKKASIAERPVRCSNCHFLFFKKNLLVAHILERRCRNKLVLEVGSGSSSKSHPMVNKVNTYNTYNCGDCNKYFRNENDLVYHSLTEVCHTKATLPLPETCSKESVEEKTPTCSKCHQTFWYQKELSEHLKKCCPNDNTSKANPVSKNNAECVESVNLLEFLEEFDKTHPKQDPVPPVCLTPPLPDPNQVKAEDPDLDIKDEFSVHHDNQRGGEVQQSCSVPDIAGPTVNPNSQFSQNKLTPTFSSYSRPAESSPEIKTPDGQNSRNDSKKPKCNNPAAYSVPGVVPLVTLPDPTPVANQVAAEPRPQVSPGSSLPYKCDRCQHSFQSYIIYQDHCKWSNYKCLATKKDGLLPSSHQPPVAQSSVKTSSLKTVEPQRHLPNFQPQQPLSSFGPFASTTPNATTSQQEPFHDINIDDLLGEVASEVDNLAKDYQDTYKSTFLCLKCDQVFNTYVECSNHGNFYHQY